MWIGVHFFISAANDTHHTNQYVKKNSRYILFHLYFSYIFFHSLLGELLHFNKLYHFCGKWVQDIVFTDWTVNKK